MKGNKQRWLSFVMAVTMMLTSVVANQTAFGAVGIMPFALIEVYANEELKHDNPPTRQPVLSNPNYSQSDGGSLIPDIVSWLKPGTNQKYMAYCIDPGKKGWESDDPYNIEIHNMTDFHEDNLLYDGAREEFTDEIVKMLVGAVAVGYPSRSAEEVLGLSFADSGLSDIKEFEYIAYLVTKFTIWTMVREDRTDSRKLDINDWEIDANCDYNQALKDAAYRAIRDVYAMAKSYTRPPAQDVQITHTSAALQSGTTNVYESIYTITNAVPDIVMSIFEKNGEPFPAELKITDINGNELTKTPKENELDKDEYVLPANSTGFKVIYTHNEGEELNYSLDLSLSAPDGGKVLIYGVALKANRQNYILAGNSYTNYSTDFTVTSEGEKPEGKLTVRKTDGNGNLLTGAVFEFVDASGNPVTVEDINKNEISNLTANGGIHTADHLPYGTYRVKEKTAPQGYDLLTDIFTMVVSEQSPTVTIDVPNTKGGSGDWYILKLDAKTGLPLPGVTFDIYSNATGAFIESGTTGANGKYIPAHQETGIYTVIERQTNSNYEYTPPTSIVVDVREDATTPVIVTFRDFSNKELRVHKVDADGKPIPGVEFEMVQIYTSTGTQGVWRGVATTDAQGWAEFDTDAAGNPPPSGAYIVREVSTVAGFIRNTTEQWVTIGQSMPPSLKFVNNKKPGLTILKQDQSDNSMITKVTKFRVEQIGGSYTWEGDTKGGMITLDDLPPGSYRITELNPPIGYVGTDEVKTVHLMPDEHIQVVFLNPHKPRLLIEKIDGQSGNPVPGTKFEIVGIDNNFKGTVTVGANGTVLVGDDGHELGYLEPGSYEVTEIFVPSPYVLTGETQTVYLGAGEIKRLTFMNLEMPSLLIEKYDEKTGAKLPGAQFGVYWQDDLGLPVFEGLTDKDGKILIEYLKPGWYTIKELTPPPGYMYSDNPLLPQVRSVQLNPGAGTVTVKFDNIKMPQLTIKKIDAVTQKPLAGFTFRVEETDGTSFQPTTVTTNANGEIIIPGLKAGTYTVTEIACPSNYILDTMPQTVKMEGGDTKTLLFQNTMYPTLVIEKLDYESYKTIANATIKIEYENSTGGTELIGTYRTDENGRITLPYVKPGWYVMTETIPAPGYQLPTDPVIRIYLAPGTNSYTNTSNGNSGGNPFTVTSGFDYPVVAGIVNYPLNAIVVKKADAVTGEMLSGATFEVLKITGQTSGQNGVIVGTVTTDSSGVQVITGLEAGAYAIKEVHAPANYLISETNMQTVNLKADGTSVCEVIFRNYPHGGILVTKVDGVTGVPLSGATFKITDSAGAAIGNTTGEYVTDSNGEIYIPNAAPGGYVITEIKAPANYIINATSKTLQVGVDGKIYKASFDNYPYGAIMISKIDGVTKEPLAGARFKVTDNSGAAVGNTTGEFVTDSSGEILINNIAPGSYIVTEIQAPANYAINMTPKTIVVGNDGKTYKVSFDNYPYGTLVIKKLDTATRGPLEGAEFKVTDSSGAVVGNSNGLFTTDTSGVITIPYLPKGSYIIEETKAPDGYVLENKTQTIDIDYGKTYTVDIYNKKMSSLQIIKIDSATKQPLKHAQFTVYKANGEIVGRYETDADGVIIVDALDPGWYKAVETKAPDGYLIDETPKDFEIKANQFVQLIFENNLMSGLLVRKVDAETLAPLSGMEFTVKTMAGLLIGNYRTDADGTKLIPELEPGWYVVTETKAPDGYSLGYGDNTQTVEITHSKLVVIEFRNKPFGSIVIKKIDEITGAPLAGANFTVSHQNGGLIGEYTTGSDGTVSIPNMDTGWYVISETKAPTGYTLDETAKTVEVKPGVPTVATFTNKPHSGIEIVKLDAVSHIPLQDATFTVERANGEKIGTYKTDVSGKIIVPDLTEGTYIVSETIAPDGYMLTESPKTVVVVSGKLTTVEFVNKPFSGIQIIKTDSVSHAPLSGATFTVVRDNGERIGQYKTDASGKIIVNDLAEGTYVVSETIAPDGYMLNEVPKTVVVKTGKLTTVEFENAPFSSLVIKKTDEITGSPLSGADFTVNHQNGAFVGDYTTGSDGTITIPVIEPGWYVIRETKAPNGYELNSTAKTVEVKSFVPTVVTFTNRPHSGIEIIKIDAVSKAPLMGATFTVERSSGEKVGTYKTDAAGKIIVSDLTEGTYIVSETIAPDGYMLTETPKTVVVTSGKLSSVEFVNKPYSGIEILKLDTITNLPLSSATFTVERDNGEKIGTYKTDLAGKIIVSDLAEGTYIVSETIAPNGYVRDEAPKTVIVKTGKLTAVEFRNKPLSGIEIIKIDAINKAPLMGATFTVERPNGEKLGTYKTDQAGKIIVPDLAEGIYIVSETIAPDGYILTETPKTVTVVSGKLTTVEFVNKPFSGIQIIKLNAESKAPLPGASFLVECDNGERIGTYKTDSTGKIIISDLAEGTYIVSETTAPDGFILDEAPKTVIVKSGKLTTIEFFNKPLAGLKIIKLDSATRQPIEGVEFVITKMSGEKVENDFRGYSFKTDRTGQIYIPNLTNGYYTVTETRSADGYILDGEPKTILIESGKPTILEVFNTPMSGLLIVKTDAQTGKPLQGVVFDVRRADGSYVAGSILDANQPNTAYNSPNKTTAPNGDITGSYTTDANGRIQINGLEAGQYMVTERKQLNGYELDTNVYDVTIVPGKLATLQLKNKPLSGLRIKKIDSVTGAPIYNTEFMVFDYNGKVVGTFYTDNAGVIDFSAILTEGRYTIRETRASEGYYIDDIPKTVEFVAGKITEIEWKNTPCMGQIQITKLSADENEVNGLPAGTPLEGAIFEVYSYKSGNIVDRFVTASSGKGVSKPLPLGRYIVKEVQAPAYYQLNNKELDITIEFATQIIKLEYTNRSANTGVTIKKTGNAEAMPGDLIRYDIKKISNDSTIPLTDFFWRDVLPVDAVRLNKIVTGTFNQSLRYKIMATTNKGNNKVIADNLSTTVNNVIDCSSASLGLYSDEFVTSFTVIFGNVKAGFTCVEQPQIFVNVSKNLPNGYEFANKCDVGGKTGNEWVIGASTWLTKIFRSTNDKLPKTGF